MHSSVGLQNPARQILISVQCGSQGFTPPFVVFSAIVWGPIVRFFTSTTGKSLKQVDIIAARKHILLLTRHDKKVHRAHRLLTIHQLLSRHAPSVHSLHVD